MGPSSRVYEVIYFTTCREHGKGRASPSDKQKAPDLTGQSQAG
jgi:hypothetical protein